MPKVFISYRRQDTLAITGRIYDKLAAWLGAENVFMDFDTIPLGVDFRKHLNRSLQDCDVLLVVIGPNWIGKVADANKARLEDPADFVRLEVQAALERDIPVVPVLVGKTPMPTEDELPPELQSLLYRQAISVDMGRDFHVHMERLMTGIERIREPRRDKAEQPARPAQAAQRVEAKEKAQEPVVQRRRSHSPLRRAFLVDEGRSWPAIALWALVGGVSGCLSWFGLQLLGGGGPLGQFFTFFVPVSLFGSAVYLVGEYSHSRRFQRGGKRSTYGFSVLGSTIGCLFAWAIGSWLLSEYRLGYHGSFETSHRTILTVALQEAEVPVSLYPIGAAVGLVGATAVALFFTWCWRLEQRKAVFVGVVAAAGGIAGFLSGLAMPYTSNSYIDSLYELVHWHEVEIPLVSWQALVLAAISTASVITRDRSGAADRDGAVLEKTGQAKQRVVSP